MHFTAIQTENDFIRDDVADSDSNDAGPNDRYDGQ